MKTKDKGHAIQFLGFLTLLAGTRGFFILKGDLENLYFPALIGAVIVFVVCLGVGGSMVKKVKPKKVNIGEV
ncbi:MAG: hypothetical protein ACI97B_004554 [Verrucomicrobiales bacterium]|jgi:hypothetical protein